MTENVNGAMGWVDRSPACVMLRGVAERVSKSEQGLGIRSATSGHDPGEKDFIVS